MAAISRINPLWPTDAMGGTSKKTLENQQDGIPIFSDVLKSAIKGVEETDAEYRKAEYLLATGQLDNPAVLNMAGSKANISVQLLTQLRNKALESYNSIVNMSV